MTVQALDRTPLFTKRALAKLIIPLIVEQILAVTIGMADTVMVTSVGEAAVSAISLVDSINILLINIFSALATGGAVVAAQYLGRDDRKSACSAAKQLLYTITLLSVFIMAFPLIWNVPILHALFGNIEPLVMQGAKTYFWLSALSFPSLALYNACAALYRAMGNSKVSMLTSLLMNLVNIVGNAILIYGFGLGVAGAAIASLFSRTLGAILMLFLIVRPTHAIFISKLYRPSLHADMVGRILRIGIPNGLENSMFQVGKLLVQGLIASFGTSAIAANAIANSVASLANTPGAAIGLGLVTVVGQCMGARAPDQAVHYTRRLMRLTYLCMGVFDVMLFLLAGPLVRMFHLSPEAASSATFILRTFAVSAIFLWPLSFTTPNALRAAGDARFTMLTSILSMWLFRIGLSYVFGRFFHMGVLGVWIAMYVDWAVRALAFTLRFERGKWRHIQVI